MYETYEHIPPTFLHTTACGDFTLLAREHWFDLRGYAEWDIFSMHLDSLFCHAAHHGGATEYVLPDPMRVYHIEHAVGTGWTPEGQLALIKRIRAAGIPDLHWRDVSLLGSLMREYGSPAIFCREDWGLANDDLPETLITDGPTVQRAK